MKQIRWLQVLCLAGAAACRESTAPVTQSLPSDVAQFLAPLPKLRSASTVFVVPEKGFLLFTASYGDPQDCPAGCFYAQAWGIKYAGRIGWIYGAAGTRYDVRTNDEFLFDESLWDRIGQEWVGAEFRIMISCDADTPPDALERLAVRLPAEGWPFLADLLVDEAQRRDDRRIAEIVAGIGPSTYNYSYSRAHAATALANWPSPPTGGYCR